MSEYFRTYCGCVFEKVAMNEYRKVFSHSEGWLPIDADERSISYHLDSNTEFVSVSITEVALLKMGAKNIALIRGILQADDIASAAGSFRKKLDKAKNEAI